MRASLSGPGAFVPLLLTLAAATGAVAVAGAEPPAEVTGVGFASESSLQWTAVPGADFYNVYRSDLAASPVAKCHGFGLAGPPYDTAAAPSSGAGYLYLVTAESTAGGEGTPGTSSAGAPRPLLGGCTRVMQNHVLDRLGYGWNEWTRDRIATLGLDSYVAEQLLPASIPESAQLFSRLAPISRPADIIQLIQHQVIRGVYSRRQLEQQVAAFWANHFNTDWAKLAELYQGAFPPCVNGQPPQCDPAYPARAYLEASTNQFKELGAFRQLSFSGSFREIVEASALSPAMIIYLDTISSVAGAPNENYPRELMELHTMGVDGGYTQQDVEELSRVVTGWSLCKKSPPNVNDPLAPCLAAYWDDDVPGSIVATFVPGLHDCTQKLLFSGTPQQVTVPDTCAAPNDGVDDLFLALDAIVAHPATARFVSRKILEQFVTEDPGPALVDVLVAEWNDASNPEGVGDLKAVLAAALSLEEFRDPGRIRTKIKTPLEQFVSALRATRGETDGATVVLGYLVNAQHIPHYNPVPTGWPETGASWLDTNNYLERQNFAIALLGSESPSFGSEPIDLLNDNGVSTAPGNSPAIVDFFVDALFGGGVTPVERQAALDFLDTNASGVPAPYDDVRIRQLVTFLLGYPQFQEQ
jgi:uncharacterized protein (DUF1800 family)